MHCACASQSLGLYWDFPSGTEPVDLDASALVFDRMGALMDAAYFNQLTAADGSVTHSGDNQTGEGAGADEVITIHCSRLPSDAKVILFVLNAHKGGSLGDMETATAKLHAGAVGGPVICDMSLGAAGAATGAVMCALFEDHRDGTWRFKDVGTFASGRHFMACMPAMRPVVDSLLDPVIVMERSLTVDKSFAMKKNDDMALPEHCTKYFVGLGWSCDDALDLDASCIMLGDGADNPVVETVYFGHKDAPGVHHCGDNTTGAGAGDDERINVDLEGIPSNVNTLAFVVNIFSPGNSFSQVQDAYVRLCDAKGNEMARYKLGGHVPTTGLVFCKLYRSGGRWRMLAVGVGAQGSGARTPGFVKVVRGERAGVPVVEMDSDVGAQELNSAAPAPAPAPAPASAATGPGTGTKAAEAGCCVVQ